MNKTRKKSDSNTGKYQTMADSCEEEAESIVKDSLLTLNFTMHDIRQAQKLLIQQQNMIREQIERLEAYIKTHNPHALKDTIKGAQMALSRHNYAEHLRGNTLEEYIKEDKKK